MEKEPGAFLDKGVLFKNFVIWTIVCALFAAYSFGSSRIRVGHSRGIDHAKAVAIRVCGRSWAPKTCPVFRSRSSLTV